jgi:hypothetical protein
MTVRCNKTKCIRENWDGVETIVVSHWRREAAPVSGKSVKTERSPSQRTSLRSFSSRPKCRTDARKASRRITAYLRPCSFQNRQRTPLPGWQNERGAHHFCRDVSNSSLPRKERQQWNKRTVRARDRERFKTTHRQREAQAR